MIQALTSLRSMSVFASVLLTGLVHAEPVQVTLSSRTIPLGGSAFLNINIQGGGDIEIEPPVVDGLIIRESGKSSNMTIVNGKFSRTASYRYTILAEKEGNIQIPEFKITIDGETSYSEPIDVVVSKSATTSSRGTQGSTTNTGQQTRTLTADQIKQFAFIELEADKTKAYIGEKVPLKVSLYLNQQVNFNQLEAPPTVQNDALIVPPLTGKEFERDVVQKNGYLYNVLSWDVHFSPTKEESTTLESSLELTLLLRARRDSRSMSRSIFDNDFFSPSYQHVPIIATSNKVELELLSLPKPSPESFNGAIGSFDISLNAQPTELEIGDPITVTIEIEGEGNFDRVSVEGLPKSDLLKTYEPEESFESTNKSNTSGKKTFKQAVIPTNTEFKALPELEFTYFNPQESNYVTVRTPPVALTIQGEVPDSSDNRGSPALVTSKESGEDRIIDHEGLIGIAVTLQKPDQAIQPMPYRKGYLIAMGMTPLSLITLIVLLSVLRENLADEKSRSLKSQNKIAHKHLQELSKHIKHNDIEGFLDEAAAYSKLLASILLNTNAGAITSADIQNKVPDEFPNIVNLLKLQEMKQYAGSTQQDIDIKSQHEALASEWKKLQAKGQQ